MRSEEDCCLKANAIALLLLFYSSTRLNTCSSLFRKDKGERQISIETEGQQ
jgi:hypothetical protein